MWTGAMAGTFKDRDGGSHAWVVDGAHSLVWDGSPYTPFGFAFSPKYLADGLTDANLAEDKAQIEALKTAGVTDVVIRPGKGLDSIPADAMQKVVDLLESAGMTYGVQPLGVNPSPLTGYVVQPSVNRIAGIRASGTVAHQVGDAKLALYVVCDAKSGDVKGSGQAVPANGEISVPVKLKSEGDYVLLYYPLRSVAPGVSTPPDIWTDFDRMRDGILACLSKVKFGKGLRFVMDPISDGLALSGESADLVPVSASFRMEFSAWLSKRYTSTRELALAWGLQDHELSTYQEAAYLIPLWRREKGIAAVYDDSTGRRYAVNVPISVIWNDLAAFRVSSVTSCMNSMADVLKRAVAEVPVVYTAAELLPIYKADKSTKFDGLSSPALTGEDLAAASGRTFSLVDNSTVPMWLLSRTRPTGAGYATKEAIFGDLNTARLLGAKGFLVDTGAGSASVPAWLAEFGSINAKDKTFASYVPKAIYYAEGTSHTSMKKLGGGTYWLPSLGSAQNLYLGPTLGGYTLADASGNDSGIYIWSTKGRQVIHLVSKAPVTIVDASGASSILQPKKNRVELEVVEEPIVIRGIAASSFLPVELVMDAVNTFVKTVARAESKGMDVGDSKERLRSVAAWLKSDQLLLAFDMARTGNEELLTRLRGVETTSITDISGAASSAYGKGDKKDPGSSVTGISSAASSAYSKGDQKEPVK